ncbi:MAG TPA: hypothetical protein VN493_22200 [Thermoanaerobaculia bacterium]|nr:hypothetical protein [Thermoanaerobaculia bacterium]
MKGRGADEPEDETLPPGAGELIYLREVLGISRKDHAHRLGHADDSLLRKYERGDKPLSRGAFKATVEPIGHAPETVDALLALHPLVKHLPPEEPPSPVALRRPELVRIDRACLAAATGVVECLRPLLIREKKRIKAEAQRNEAEEIWPELQVASWKRRRELVETWPRYRTWAMAERICEASIKAAAHRADQALDLARFALFIGERIEEIFRDRTAGYCWAHVGNAQRVGEDFEGADRSFVRAWRLWNAGVGSDPDLLLEWKLFSLEASLRRAQRRFPEALERLDDARKCSGRNRLAASRILMNRSNVFHQAGDAESALAALEEATPLIEGLGDPQLLVALRFNRADLLTRLERYEQSERLLLPVRQMAAAQGNGLSLLRVDWLEAKICAGLGNKEEAMARLDKVCEDFTARKHPYDAALSGLDLALLKLEAGFTTDAKWVAVRLAWIFDSKKIRREALAALRIFYDAAMQEAATVELTRQVIADIERTRHSASAASD